MDQAGKIIEGYVIIPRQNNNISKLQLSPKLIKKADNPFKQKSLPREWEGFWIAKQFSFLYSRGAFRLPFGFYAFSFL